MDELYSHFNTPIANDDPPANHSNNEELEPSEGHMPTARNQSYNTCLLDQVNKGVLIFFYLNNTEAQNTRNHYLNYFKGDGLTAPPKDGCPLEEMI